MKIGDVATREELAPFTRKSDWEGAKLVAWNWASIAAIFAVVALCVHKSRIDSDELVELATAQVLGALRSPLPHP